MDIFRSKLSNYQRLYIIVWGYAWVPSVLHLVTLHDSCGLPTPAPNPQTCCNISIMSACASDLTKLSWIGALHSSCGRMPPLVHPIVQLVAQKMEWLWASAPLSSFNGRRSTAVHPATLGYGKWDRWSSCPSRCGWVDGWRGQTRPGRAAISGCRDGAAASASPALADRLFSILLASPNRPFIVSVDVAGSSLTASRPRPSCLCCFSPFFTLGLWVPLPSPVFWLLLPESLRGSFGLSHAGAKWPVEPHVQHRLLSPSKTWLHVHCLPFLQPSSDCKNLQGVEDCPLEPFHALYLLPSSFLQTPPISSLSVLCCLSHPPFFSCPDALSVPPLQASGLRKSSLSLLSAQYAPPSCFWTTARWMLNQHCPSKLASSNDQDLWFAKWHRDVWPRLLQPFYATSTNAVDLWLLLLRSELPQANPRQKG